MKHAKFISFLIVTSFLALNLFASEAKIGESAPGFTLVDSKGNEHSLSDYEGKYVVLEWINYDCPFVKKHYESGNMQSLQKEYTEKDVVWLTVCSSVPDKQGNFSNEEINSRSEAHGANFTAYLIDDTGEVGKAYGAKTTPHMYIINPEGILEYAGGIDDIPSADQDDIAEATNYVKVGLDALMNGEEVEVKTSKPYGCSVKY